MPPIPLQTPVISAAAASVSSLSRTPERGAPRVSRTTLRRVTTLLGHCIVVAALKLPPVGLGILGTRQVLGPSLAGDQIRRLPNDVELAICAYLADIDGLGDVVVRQHFGGAAR